jgi:hypothetical protein
MAAVTGGTKSNIPYNGGITMSEFAEIKSYIKKIQNELGEIDDNLKKSIIQDIEEHLNEKIEQSRKANNGKISQDNISKILSDFGEPREIANEYRQQLSEEIQPSPYKKKIPLKKMIFTLVVIMIVVSLIFIYFRLPAEDEDNNTIYEGKGLDSIQIDDNLDEIINQYGEPEDRIDSESYIWISYKGTEGLDFLLSKPNEKIVEIRFNQRFTGSLSNGISIGSHLDEVLNKSGGAKKTVQTNYSETMGVTLGTDRVLYEQVIDGNITAYKYIDAERGILYWFNLNKELTQIVVFKA